MAESIQSGGGKKGIFFDTPPYFIYCRNDDELEYSITPKYYKWLKTHSSPIISKDFIGWMFPLYYYKPLCGLLDISGHIYFHSLRDDYSLTPEIQRKALKKGLLAGKIRRASNDPFPETSFYNNLELEWPGAIIVDDDRFKGVSKIDYTRCYEVLCKSIENFNKIINELLEMVLKDDKESYYISQ